MSANLTTIQSDVRVWAQDSLLDLTSGDYLRVANHVYLAMCTPGCRVPLGNAMLEVGRRWPELTVMNTSLTTTSGTATYAWPTSSPFDQESVEIEILLSALSSLPWLVPRALDMDDWRLHWSPSTGYPTRYRLYTSGGVVYIEFRPTPNTTGDTIRILGVQQPTAFTDGSSTTVFTNSAPDKALALLIAAHVKASRGQPNEAAMLAAQAKGYLPMWDMTPAIVTRGQAVPFKT